MEQFKDIKNVVKNILQRYCFLQDLNKIYCIWEEIVGKKIAKKIELCGIKNGVLLVKINSYSYNYHFKLYKSEWLKKINSIFKKNLNEENFEIKDIKVINYEK